MKALLPAAVALCVLAMMANTALAETTSTSQSSAYVLTHLRTHVNALRAKRCLPAIHIAAPNAATLPASWRATVIKRWLWWHYKAHHLRSQCGTHSASGSSWAVLDRDFHGPLQLAARTFGVSYGWLHACDHSEGSDSMVWNHGGSGAFGPMQFMSGTFSSNVGPAFALARARGVAIPSQYARWDSNVGQAFTAAYMFMIGQSGQWTGAGC